MLTGAILIFPVILVMFAHTKPYALSLTLAYGLGVTFMLVFTLLNTLLQTNLATNCAVACSASIPSPFRLCAFRQSAGGQPLRQSASAQRW